jgi:N-methylhydantoinase A/oxoprolinase/acetone carboxylase beta subunit
VLQRVDARRIERWQRRVEQLARRLRSQLEAGLGVGPVRVAGEISCRYEGQSFELRVPLSANLRALFETEHSHRYGFKLPHQTIECVALHVSATRDSGIPLWTARQVRRRPVPRAALLRRVPVVFDRSYTTPQVERSALEPGMFLEGPVLVVEPTATLVVEPGFTLRVDADRRLRLEQRARRPRRERPSP